MGEILCDGLTHEKWGIVLLGHGAIPDVLLPSTFDYKLTAIRTARALMEDLDGRGEPTRARARKRTLKEYARVVRVEVIVRVVR